ncbi:MAG: glycerol-3-phosphate 1-O-acyltransferase PlsY [Bacillota bacterium]
MQQTFMLILLIAGAYFLGSIPFGYLICKAFTGKDVRKTGSGNIGTTNVMRMVGLKGALLVFALDFLKGFVPAFLALHYGGEIFGLLIGIAAVLGHDLSIWLKFKGGKGAATSVAVMFALMPWAGVVAMVTWAITIAITRYVSLGTCMAAVAIFIYSFVADISLVYKIVIYIIAVVIVFMHRSNLKRIAKGEELKVGKKKSVNTD